MKAIKAYEIIDHGVEHSSYFQGCGTSFTEFSDVATGIGDNAAEALEECLEQLAQGCWIVETKALDAEMEKAKRDVSEVCDGCEWKRNDDDDDDDDDETENPCEMCEAHRFVSVRVR